MAWKKRTIWWLFGFTLMFLLFASQQQLSAAPTGGVRNDGCTIVKLNQPKEETVGVCYLTMIIKTGYVNDPKDKAGLTDLTNELCYYLLRSGSAININLYTAAEFSYFNFMVSKQNWEAFCWELDSLIHQDALMVYDLCNQLTRDHLSEPHPAYLSAIANYHELIYGENHPYLSLDHPRYRDLTIADINNWFRLIYRPNNLIIAASAELPGDFLRRPFGRDIQNPLKFPDIPAASLDVSSKTTFTAIHHNLSTIVMGFPAPRADQADCFPTILIQKYLQQQLYDVLCEQAGLCNTIHVSYSYFNESSSPTLTIDCQSLPENATLVVKQIVQVLKKMRTEGIPGAQENRILDQETRQMIIHYYSLEFAVQNLALQTYFNQDWIGDVAVYNDKLSKVSAEQVKKFIAGRLPYLKLSIAGPAGTNSKEVKLDI